MTTRKHYTFNATIKKKLLTKEEEMIKDKALGMYIDKLLELQSLDDEKLVQN